MEKLIAAFRECRKFATLTVDEVAKFVDGGKQSFRQGKVVLGDLGLYELRIKRVGVKWTVTGICTASLSADTYYSVSVTASADSLDSSTCVCAARSNTHNRCKHVAAVLLGVVTLVHHSRDDRFPAHVDRSGFKILEGAEDSYIYQASSARFKMRDLTARLVAEFPAASASFVLKEPVVRKRKKKEHCLCRCTFTGRFEDGLPPDAEPRKLVLCDGCKTWFHFECLRDLHGRTDLDPDDPKSHKTFRCPSCTAVAKRLKHSVS